MSPLHNVSLASALAPRMLVTAFLLAASVTDVRTRRIPNVLVLALAGAACVRAAATAWAGAPPTAVAHAFAAVGLGAIAGLALWLPLYAAGALGAGDVKLFAAAAAWIGPAAVPTAALYTAVAGGVLGLAWLAAQRLPGSIAAGARPRVPYGIAIAAGVLGVVWGRS